MSFRLLPLEQRGGAVPLLGNMFLCFEWLSGARVIWGGKEVGAQTYGSSGVEMILSQQDVMAVYGISFTGFKSKLLMNASIF